MEANIKDTIKIVKKMDKELIFGLMEVLTMAVGEKISLMDMYIFINYFILIKIKIGNL